MTWKCILKKTWKCILEMQPRILLHCIKLPPTSGGEGMEGKIPHTYHHTIPSYSYFSPSSLGKEPLSSIFLLLPLRERKTYNVFMERKTNTRYNKCCGGIPKMTKNQLWAYGADLYFPKLSSSAFSRISLRSCWLFEGWPTPSCKLTVTNKN